MAKFIPLACSLRFRDLFVDNMSFIILIFCSRDGSVENLNLRLEQNSDTWPTHLNLKYSHSKMSVNAFIQLL